MIVSVPSTCHWQCWSLHGRRLITSSAPSSTKIQHLVTNSISSLWFRIDNMETVGESFRSTRNAVHKLQRTLLTIAENDGMIITKEIWHDEYAERCSISSTLSLNSLNSRPLVYSVITSSCKQTKLATEMHRFLWQGQD